MTSSAAAGGGDGAKDRGEESKGGDGDGTAVTRDATRVPLIRSPGEVTFQTSLFQMQGQLTRAMIGSQSVIALEEAAGMTGEKL